MIVRRLVHGSLAPNEAEQLLATARNASFNYDHVGSTLDPAAWPDRQVEAKSKRLGSGRDMFDIATARLRAWAPQRRLGALVLPQRAEVEPGATVLVVLRLGLLAIVVPDRVVDVIVEPDRYGWAYGSLPGHAEAGEEGFMVAIDGDGAVTATITLDAVPTGVAALGAPLTRAFQHLAVRRYLEALVP